MNKSNAAISMKVPQESHRSAQLAITIEAFSQYNESLRTILESINCQNYYQESIKRVDNSFVMKKLRDLIPIKDLRTAGSFFTGDELADEAVSKFDKPICADSIVLDPTCGAGNLLIACSKKLPIKLSLKKTLKFWGNVLAGWDIFPEFVEATKLRIIQEAIQRGCVLNGDNLKELKGYLSKIEHRDALTESTDYSKVTHLIMNPPFGIFTPPNKCFWAGGKINAASYFFDHIINKLALGVCIAAILPEVLRSGTRYTSWRILVDNCVNHKLQLSGKFDKRTNVDVFLLSGVIKQRQEKEINIPKWTANSYESERTVSDKFNIFIGPVVPYRDEEKGTNCPFIFPRILPIWKELGHFSDFRKFSGRIVIPPFVAIRRTSSPADRQRAAATLIKGDQPVAVENHLIVALPKSRGISECRKLMRVLKNSTTNDFLNCRIRCRHLTAGAVKEIPWEEG